MHALGTCGNHVAAGDSGTIVILTDGGSTHNERLWEELRKPAGEQDPAVTRVSREQYAAQKEQEVREACGYLGITDVRVFGYPDRPIRRTDEMVQRVADLICELRPDIFIGELPEIHRHDRLWITPNDHTACAAIAQEAITVASLAMLDKDRVPHRIARIYYLATEKSYDAVDVYVDVSARYEGLLKAEASFLSQSHTPEYARVRLERGIGVHGWRAKVAYAETFVRANMEVHRRLPVTDHDLRLAREGDPTGLVVRGVRGYGPERRSSSEETP